MNLFQSVKLGFRPFLQFLLPANEVWGKIMFLHLCAILFSGCVCIPACITGHMTGGLCLGVSVQGGLCPGGSLSMGVSVGGGLCLGGLYPGGLCPGESLSGRPSIPDRDPPPPKYGYERVVRILLECILVKILFR